MNVCPVCGYDGLEEPPYANYSDPSTGSFEICSCCGFQFGVDDLDKGISHTEYRDQWIKNGAKWYSKSVEKPNNWDLISQLLRIGIKL
mgnify:FL=1|jgi:hypothetical protein